MENIRKEIPENKNSNANDSSSKSKNSNNSNRKLNTLQSSDSAIKKKIVLNGDSIASNPSSNPITSNKFLKCSDCSIKELKTNFSKCFTCKKELCEKCTIKDLKGSNGNINLKNSSFVCTSCIHSESKQRKNKLMSISSNGHENESKEFISRKTKRENEKKLDMSTNMADKEMKSHDITATNSKITKNNAVLNFDELHECMSIPSEIESENTSSKQTQLHSQSQSQLQPQPSTNMIVEGHAHELKQIENGNLNTHVDSNSITKDKLNTDTPSINHEINRMKKSVRTRKLYEEDQNVINCHECRKIESIINILTCRNDYCRESYCFRCTAKHYAVGINSSAILKLKASEEKNNWICFKCKFICKCKVCKFDVTNHNTNNTNTILNKKRRISRKKLISHSNAVSKAKIQGESVKPLLPPKRSNIISISFSKDEIVSNVDKIEPKNVVEVDNFILFENNGSDEEERNNCIEIKSVEKNLLYDKPITCKRNPDEILNENENKIELENISEIDVEKKYSQDLNKLSLRAKFCEQFYKLKYGGKIISKKCVICKIDKFESNNLIRFRNVLDIFYYIFYCFTSKEILLNCNSNIYEENKSELLLFINELEDTKTMNDYNIRENKNICKICLMNLLNTEKALQTLIKKFNIIKTSSDNLDNERSNKLLHLIKDSEIKFSIDIDKNKHINKNKKETKQQFENQINKNITIENKSENKRQIPFTQLNPLDDVVNQNNLRFLLQILSMQAVNFNKNSKQSSLEGDNITSNSPFTNDKIPGGVPLNHYQILRNNNNTNSDINSYTDLIRNYISGGNYINNNNQNYNFNNVDLIKSNLMTNNTLNKVPSKSSINHNEVKAGDSPSFLNKDNKILIEKTSINKLIIEDGSAISPLQFNNNNSYCNSSLFVDQNQHKEELKNVSLTPTIINSEPKQDKQIPLAFPNEGCESNVITIQDPPEQEYLLPSVVENSYPNKVQEPEQEKINVGPIVIHEPTESKFQQYFYNFQEFVNNSQKNINDRDIPFNNPEILNNNQYFCNLQAKERIKEIFSKISVMQNVLSTMNYNTYNLLFMQVTMNLNEIQLRLSLKHNENENEKKIFLQINKKIDEMLKYKLVMMRNITLIQAKLINTFWKNLDKFNFLSQYLSNIDLQVEKIKKNISETFASTDNKVLSEISTTMFIELVESIRLIKNEIELSLNVISELNPLMKEVELFNYSFGDLSNLNT